MQKLYKTVTKDEINKWYEFTFTVPNDIDKMEFEITAASGDSAEMVERFSRNNHKEHIKEYVEIGKVELNTLEDLLWLIKDVGTDLVIDESRIIIYDTYLE